MGRGLSTTGWMDNKKVYMTLALGLPSIMLRSEPTGLRQGSRCGPAALRGVAAEDSLDHLCRVSIGLLRARFGMKEERKPYIRTLASSPPEANMHGSAGFHATELTQPH